MKIECLLFSVFCVATTLGQNELELIGGHEDKSHQYPEVVYVNNYFSACTATLIGERVLLLASHCAADNTYIQSDKSGKQTFAAQCHHAPIDKAPDLDFALCLIDRDVYGPFAKIGNEELKIDDRIVLMGYGCTASNGSGGNDGILRFGLARIAAIPSQDRQYFRTQDSTTLCSGDSGGPAMLNDQSHTIVGVNSRGDMRETSLLVALYLKVAQDYFHYFVDRYNVEICGVNKEC